MNHIENILTPADAAGNDSAKNIACCINGVVKYISPAEQVEGREVLFSQDTRAPFKGDEAQYTTQRVWLPELNNPATNNINFDVNLIGIAYGGENPRIFRAEVERTLTPDVEDSWAIYQFLGVVVKERESITNYMHVRERVPASWWRIKTKFPDSDYVDCFSRLIWAAYNRPLGS